MYNQFCDITIGERFTVLPEENQHRRHLIASHYHRKLKLASQEKQRCCTLESHLYNQGIRGQIKIIIALDSILEHKTCSFHVRFTCLWRVLHIFKYICRFIVIELSFKIAVLFIYCIIYAWFGMQQFRSSNTILHQIQSQNYITKHLSSQCRKCHRPLVLYIYGVTIAMYIAIGVHYSVYGISQPYLRRRDEDNLHKTSPREDLF